MYYQQIPILKKFNIKSQRIITLRSYLKSIISQTSVEKFNDKLIDHHFNQYQFLDAFIYIYHINYKSHNWNIQKTYQDFQNLHTMVNNILKQKAPIFPKQPKIQLNTDQLVIPHSFYQFQHLLQSYLKNLCEVPQVKKQFDEFINFPTVLDSTCIKRIEFDVIQQNTNEVVHAIFDKKFIKFKNSYNYLDFNVEQTKVRFNQQFHFRFCLNYSISYIIKLQLGDNILHFRVQNNCLQFIQILDHIYQGIYQNRYRSFAPIRNSCNAEFLIDGQDYFKSVFQSIQSAKQTIFLTDWFLSPELFLKRPVNKDWKKNGNNENTLKNILEQKSIEGIKIFIIIWKSSSIEPNNSVYVHDTIANLKGGNIKIISHPHNNLLFAWTHHQKILIIDQKIGYVSGMDLCYGRYDTHKHKLFDNLESHTDLEAFPGLDYYNGLKADFKHIDDYKNQSDYLKRSIPRLPWHDSSVKLTGRIVYDLSYQFVNYFNVNIQLCCYNKNKQCQPSFFQKLFQGPPVFSQFIKSARHQTVDFMINNDEKIPNINHLQNIPKLKPYLQIVTGTMQCQIVRSASKWSHKIPEKQNSIQNAYLQLITNSKHYIYIQNQYLISSSSGSKFIYNQVVQKIVHRILKAHTNKEKFKVYILIPLVPEFVADFVDLSDPIKRLQTIIQTPDQNVLGQTVYWQNNTISQSDYSIYKSLIRHGINDPFQYIQVFSLRNHEINPSTRLPETEIIYVHSKMMIVDDQYVIMGSANLNDRSMNGDRDSEVNIVISDTKKLVTLMDGKITEVGKKINQLRIQIFKQHFGIECSAVLDPVSDQSWQELRYNAKKNTEIYESIFYCHPTNTVKTFKQLTQFKQKHQNRYKNQQDLLIKMYKQKIADLHGQVVLYPDQFLSEDRQKMRTKLIQSFGFQIIT